MYKPDREALQRQVREIERTYGFKGLLHFTDLTNLLHIFCDDSLKSREQCEGDGIKFLDAADHDIIEHTQVTIKKCVRFYYKELTPTLYKNEGIKMNDEKPHVPLPVYLLFDKSLIYLNNTFFSDGNAKSIDTRFAYDANFFKSMDWQTIFHRGPINGDYPYRKEVKRKRHAELLSAEPVPLKYLNKIILRCEADRKRAIHKFGRNPKFNVDSSMFNNNNIYIVDYNTDVVTTGKYKNLRFTWKFNNINYSCYKHYCRIIDERNTIVSESVLDFSNRLQYIWYLNINNLPNKRLFLEYYIDNTLCIEQYI